MTDRDHTEIRIRRGLQSAASWRAQTDVSKTAATHELVKWARRADKAGFTRTEIAKLAGVSREGLYVICGWRK